MVGFLDAECINISEIELDIATVTINAMDIPTTIKEKVMKKDQNAIPSDFITSPADVAGPHKADLQDFEVTAEETEAFTKLCDKYADVFSDNSGDIGRTPLIKMDIDTGENPPVCQRPYTLPLKHAEWVKKELNILEVAGIIVRSVSPWASPIVVVPKRSAPGEPPKRRMCVDYRALNKLLLPVKKAHSNAKGVLSLVPLPKIDEIFACLKGSKVFSTLDMHSGYTLKEVKQFLGLVGYYRKFVPRYADIARPLNALTRKDVDFVWTDICQKSFELLKTMVSEEPI